MQMKQHPRANYVIQTRNGIYVEVYTYNVIDREQAENVSKIVTGLTGQILESGLLIN